MRIVCRLPEGPERPPRAHPLLNERVPSIADCAVYIDDKEVTNVISIVFAVGRNEPATAWLECCGVEVELETLRDESEASP
jgi:hypothetical protein